MRVSEAKDFLVQQTAEQALLDGLPLSDLEKRMMYFTEGDEAHEDPTKLNDEFEAEYETAAYEAKTSKLLHHAYARVKKENPESARLWDESIRVLRKGDHYILVLWDERSSTERPPHDSLKLLGTAILVIALMLGFFVLLDHYGIDGNSRPKTYTSMPFWIQRLVIALMAGTYVYYVILPWILKKTPMEIGQSLLRVLRAEPKDKPER
jgi:hypothetical protein